MYIIVQTQKIFAVQLEESGFASEDASHSLKSTFNFFFQDDITTTKHLNPLNYTIHFPKSQTAPTQLFPNIVTAHLSAGLRNSSRFFKGPSKKIKSKPRPQAQRPQIQRKEKVPLPPFLFTAYLATASTCEQSLSRLSKHCKDLDEI